MKITAISVKNVLGVEEASHKCGKITTIKGRNASGKTSRLEAIKAAVGGGNLATLTRKDASEEPEVVLVLDDGAFRIEKASGKVVVKQRIGDSAGYQKIEKPQTFLDSLFDATLANPVKLLQAKPMDRVDWILECLPVTLDPNAVVSELPTAARSAVKEASLKGHPFVALTAIRQDIFDERTAVNRSQKDKAASAYELQKSIPAEMPEDPGRVVNELRSEYQRLMLEVQRSKDAANTDYGAALAKFRADWLRADTDVSAEYEREIAEMRAELERKIVARKEVAADITKMNADAYDVARGEAEKVRDATLAQVATEVEPALVATREKLIKAQLDAEMFTRAEETKRLSDKFAAESTDLEATSEELTAAIKQIDLTKAKLAAECPIKGLEIEGKDIKIDGVPFDQQNAEMRYRVAVQAAIMRCGGKKLPLLFIDGAEAFDEEHFDLLLKIIDEAGVQAFVSRVTDTDLIVDSK